jgi:hypothetical protein
VPTVSQSPRKRVCSLLKTPNEIPFSIPSPRWRCLPPSPNPGVGLYASPNPRQRASSLDSIPARAGLHAPAPPFHIMERIQDQPFKLPGASPIRFWSEDGRPPDRPHRFRTDSGGK